MKTTLTISVLVLSCLLLTTGAYGQQDTLTRKKGLHYIPPAERAHPVKGVYLAGGGDGTILSFASVKDYRSRIRDLPRYTLVLNIGCSFNYDFSGHAGVFSGLNLKNIGLITRQDSLKVKRRVYTLGVPVGLKFGDFDEDFFFYFGAQCELPVNYKEKRFVHGRKTGKFQEWLSDRTPPVMPSVFAGIKMHEFNVRIQYYPGNFFDTRFRETRPELPDAPYGHLKATLFFVSFGYSFPIHKGS